MWIKSLNRRAKKVIRSSTKSRATTSIIFFQKASWTCSTINFNIVTVLKMVSAKKETAVPWLKVIKKDMRKGSCLRWRKICHHQLMCIRSTEIMKSDPINIRIILELLEAYKARTLEQNPISRSRVVFPTWNRDMNISKMAYMKDS